MLKIKNLNHQFGKQGVIKDITFQTKEAGLYVFAGANGCGKSTLFRLIGGLCLPYSGSIELNNVTCANEYRRHLGLSLEPFKTEPNLKLGQILKMAQEEKYISDDEIDYWLGYWQLKEAINKKFKALSVGMVKRLSLITAFLGEPPVLVLDEPFNGLDPLGIELLQKVLERKIVEGKLILLSTHLLSELSNTMEQVIIMEKGQIKKVLDKNEVSNSENKSVIMQWLQPQTQL
ncbi:ABC transporter ATP-binding protein [Carboxylicivirga sp. A043]|uniref:ATP-binding cassette domain-containing protein n=1 Tax=Carboxylicivirga litoralis TaxID=2816963 RepID=UPI0021CB56E5|nr:ABC transporter ATP-binding protein [Carboxylicivirga sp. A043]MCU4156049.1 ABC transporter ATP-binding protein [Carboxylicivirga sp. A043]